MTSHKPPPASFQRATCAAVLSTGRASPARANANSLSRTPWRTESDAPSGSGPSARASSQVATKKSRHPAAASRRSEEHTSELQSLMRISYAVFCLKKKHTTETPEHRHNIKEQR